MTENVVADPAIVAPTELKFEITDTKLYIPVVTLPKKKKCYKAFLEQSKTAFKRTIK